MSGSGKPDSGQIEWKSEPDPQMRRNQYLNSSLDCRLSPSTRYRPLHRVLCWTVHQLPRESIATIRPRTRQRIATEVGRTGKKD